MNNIMQKFFRYTCLLSCLIIFSSCQTPQNPQIQAQIVEIAILMPLTGSNAEIGKQYDELIKMGIKDGLDGNINVVSYDGSDEEQIAESMRKIIARKTKIILGPISSPLTSFISSEAEKNNIIIISMSNDPALALPELFVFGHAPMKQLDQIVNYYLDRRYENFIALLPAGKHSVLVNKILQAAIVKKNGALMRSEFYDENSESMSKSISIVSDSVDNLNEIESNTNKPIVFISDDSKNLTKLLSNTTAYSLDKKAIIVSDNRVDIDSLDPFNISFTGAMKKINSRIKEKAEELEINSLSYMHLLAYDLGNLAATYIGEKFEEQEFLAKMNSSRIFSGVSGRIHFTDSIAQRDYDIIRKEDGNYTNITREE